MCDPIWAGGLDPDSIDNLPISIGWGVGAHSWWNAPAMHQYMQNGTQSDVIKIETGRVRGMGTACVRGPAPAQVGGQR